MQININSGDSLTAVQAGATTTTNPTARVDYQDKDGPRTEMTSLAGATAVTLLSGPTTGSRSVSAISIFNGDSVSQTVTLSLVQDGTSYTLTKIALAAGDTLSVTESGIHVLNSAGQQKLGAVASNVSAVDDTPVILGTGDDVYLVFSTGDASNHTFVIGLDDTSQSLHITDKAAFATDWNVSANTHPTIYVHSNTTPATDYLRLGNHNGTSAEIDVVGGTTLNLQIAGSTIATLTAGGLQDYGSAAVTATVGGGTTGLIPAKTKLAIVTSDNADKQISLPAATVGDEIEILVGSTACELISAVATHKVNDVVVGATNELALTAESLYRCKYVATDKWVVTGLTKLGAAEAALVPDAL